MAKANTRTWAVWLGIGDHTNTFTPMLYTHEIFEELDDTSLPVMTS